MAKAPSPARTQFRSYLCDSSVIVSATIVLILLVLLLGIYVYSRRFMR